MVASWPSITVGEGRFNATTFQTGPGEIGHVHPWGAGGYRLSTTTPGPVDRGGRTGNHHVILQSNVTTISINAEADIDNAVWLRWVSYLYHVRIQNRADADETLAVVDVERELAAAEVSDELRAIFEDNQEVSYVQSNEQDAPIAASGGLR